MKINDFINWLSFLVALLEIILKLSQRFKATKRLSPKIKSLFFIAQPEAKSTNIKNHFHISYLDT